MMSLKAFILVCSVFVTAGHVCVLSPPQRTPLKNINKPGSDSCIMLKGPCGGTKPSTTKLSVLGGSNVTVVFQKNLDHFYKAAPGFWSVSAAKSQESSFTELYRVSDNDLPSLSLYTASVYIPDIGSDDDDRSLVIQTRYVPNNPKAPPAFYQCSDIVVRGKGQ